MKKIFLLWSCLSMTFVSNAQDIESILLAGDDASRLTQNYVDPLMKGLMYGMNNGWYTTAKVHNTLGFDVTITANFALVPSADEFFAFRPADYQFLSTQNGETSLPTLLSSSDSETTINVSIPTDMGTFKVGNFDMPGGISDDLPLNAVPTPMVQVGIGLPFKTDLKLRFVPELNFDEDIKANLVGFGLQHDLTHYLGPIDRLPLSVSVLGAFTTMNVTATIIDEDPTDNIIVSNGEAAFKMNTFTVQALGSLDFKIVTVYGGIGYNKGTSTTKINGDYTLEYTIVDSGGNTIGTASESISNPIDLDFEASGVRATLGARINIGFFKLFADFTLQEYNTASAGFAFSFR